MAIQNERGALSLAEKQGHQRGRLEGKEEGRAEGLRASIRKILQKRGLMLGSQQEALLDATRRGNSNPVKKRCVVPSGSGRFIR